MRSFSSVIGLSAWRGAPATIVVLIALAGLGGFHRWLGERNDGAFDKLVKTLRNRNLNSEDAQRLNAGYYEGLLDEGSRVASTKNLVQFGPAKDAIPRGPLRLSSYERARGDFLYYDLKPNLDSVSRGGVRFVTNSFGLADREYAQQKPPHTWRIAMVGDSLVRGMGTSAGESFEALLEVRLNERHLNGDIRGFEILNFGVEAYRITQMVEVVYRRASSFKPDVYVVSLSPLTVHRAWGQHLANLVRDRIDLKYDFLRKVAHDARLRPDDKLGTSEAKLAAFRIPTIRWALNEMRTAAARHGASLIVLLTPTVASPEEYDADDFARVRTLVREMGLPNIDLLDTFGGDTALREFWIDEVDHHPNPRGHQMLLENLYRKALANPDILSKLTGRGK